MTRITRGTVVVGMCVLVGACSNQQLYTAVQQNRQHECGKLPQPQYEECMRDYGQPYDEFERERRALLDSESEETSLQSRAFKVGA